MNVELVRVIGSIQKELADLKTSFEKNDVSTIQDMRREVQNTYTRVMSSVDQSIDDLSKRIAGLENAPAPAVDLTEILARLDRLEDAQSQKPHGRGKKASE